MKTRVKISDLVAGTVAAFVAMIYVTPQHLPPVERILLIVAALAGLYGGWRVAVDRHWIVKIFFFVGAVLLSLSVTDLIVTAFGI